MSRPSRRRLVAVLVVLSAAAASAQPADRPHGGPIDSLARAFAEAHGLPSLVVGVVVDGERTVVGVGEVAGTAPGAHTIYEIGSVSKVLTSLTLADAVARGETTLETPVADLLDGAVGAHPDGPIQLVDLSTHTSGLPPLADNWQVRGDMADPYAAYDPDLLYAFLGTVTPATPRGTAYVYSNAGAGLLGFALAQRAGTDYTSLVTDRVLTPLGMAQTWTAVPDSLTLATAHGAGGTPVPWWTFQDPTAGAGAWRSTAADVLTLLEAALDPASTPLADALALTLTPHADAPPSGGQIGLGWHVNETPFGRLAWHNGMVGGSASFAGLLPESGVAVVVLTNRQANVDALGVEILRRLAVE